MSVLHALQYLYLGRDLGPLRSVSEHYYSGFLNNPFHMQRFRTTVLGAGLGPAARVCFYKGACKIDAVSIAASSRGAAPR